MIFTNELVEKKSSKVKLAIKHLKELNERKPYENMALTYDIGYCAYDILFNHLYYGINILLRLDSDFLHKKIEQLSSDDEILTLYLNKYITNKITDDTIREKYEKEVSVQIRITKVKVTPPNGKTYTETLLSTLPMEEFSKRRFKRII